MKPFPSVSIVFPNFNGGKEPLECLDSISKLNYPKTQLETIVVDNHSTDGSPDKIAHRYPWVKLIRFKQNIGFIKAVNQGIKIANGAYIFIGNDDLTFSPSSLNILVKYLERNKNVGVAGGQIFYKNNPAVISAAGFNINKWTGHVYSPVDNTFSQEVDWIQGCALLTRTSLLKRLDLLDEGFGFIYFEDTDLCFRVKKAGYKIIYKSRVIFQHGATTTMNKNKPLKYFQWYKNKFRFVLKHLSLIQIFSVFSLHIFIILPYRFLTLGDGRFIPFIKGLQWNLIHLPETLKTRYVG